jgi:hypothetical protein
MKAKPSYAPLSQKSYQGLNHPTHRLGRPQFYENYRDKSQCQGTGFGKRLEPADKRQGLDTAGPEI